MILGYLAFQVVVLLQDEVWFDALEFGGTGQAAHVVRLNFFCVRVLKPGSVGFGSVPPFDSGF